ncbi:MAG TPA: ROK family protein [Actinomycetota bacterium]|nr:ROK family protein [Actinomycetota bacterium]
MLTAGVDLGGTKVFAALVDEAGEIRARATRPTEPDAATRSTLRTLAALLDASDERPSAVGVAAAAMVERPSGRAMFSPNLAFEDPDLGAAIRGRFGLPSVVVNDATAATWAEHQHGAGRGVADMILLTVGTGIGGGAIVDGRLLQGDRGYAGEFGHITLVEGGPMCGCGQRGCLEALASGTAIGRMAREGIGSAGDSIVLELAGDQPQRITGALVAEAAHAGDEYAAGILERAGRWLGTGLASLVNVFDPALVVVGGGAAGAGWFLLEPARQELGQRVGDRRPPPRIVAAALGNDAGALGAAALAREHAAHNR